MYLAFQAWACSQAKSAFTDIANKAFKSTFNPINKPVQIGRFSVLQAAG
jgi:hypothetical protein